MYLVATLPALGIQGSNQNGSGSKKRILLKWSEEFSNSVTVTNNSPPISYVFSSGQEAEINFSTVKTDNTTNIVTVTMSLENKSNTISIEVTLLSFFISSKYFFTPPFLYCIDIKP